MENQRKTLIQAVRNTMDTIEVRGIENMRKMVLCYDTLESISEGFDIAVEDSADDSEEVDEDG